MHDESELVIGWVKKKRGVLPLRRWMKDSMAAPRLRRHPGRQKSKVTLLSLFGQHKGCDDAAAVGVGDAC
jgi:hypothetical protein